ncbi:hypothetical protein KIN20_006952 [Parelaphostrongylus tenuis]|uniref:Uncharacterized protein n=1 Tax=Parelaphostrongylus tenuis TaxID=148309 RepID=A0AAD5MNW5_PARTN|nr:hypothetical protein KIN20_006952 [Parelaphostrongylus tenuis]
MEQRLLADNRPMEHPELGHGRTSDSMAALADQLVLEFFTSELTEPPAAHLARMSEIAYVFTAIMEVLRR